MNSSDYNYTTRYCFIAQWYCYASGRMRTFNLNYYPYDNTVEMRDLDRNQIFLKRSEDNNIKIQDFFIGNTVRIYSRQLKLIDYGDNFTRDIVSNTMAHTITLIKPIMYQKLGTIINELQKHNFKIFKMRMVLLTRREAFQFYNSKKGDVSLHKQIEHIISGYCVGMEIVGMNAIQRWLDIIGPSDPVEARKTHPNSLRARYGVNLSVNALHAASDYQSAVAEACFFFPKDQNTTSLKSTLVFKNSTCCIIKPHVTSQGDLGNIITSIEENPLFRITALRIINFDDIDCREFTEVYKGVVADYNLFMLSYMDGPCVALEICGYSDDVDVQQMFRNFCGPLHSNIAKQIKPNSLRAMYGIDKYFNAVHCTDLPEDVALELEYVFHMMD